MGLRLKLGNGGYLASEEPPPKALAERGLWEDDGVECAVRSFGLGIFAKSAASPIPDTVTTKIP